MCTQKKSGEPLVYNIIWKLLRFTYIYNIEGIIRHYGNDFINDSPIIDNVLSSFAKFLAVCLSEKVIVFKTRETILNCSLK